MQVKGAAKREATTMYGSGKEEFGQQGDEDAEMKRRKTKMQATKILEIF